MHAHSLRPLLRLRLPASRIAIRHTLRTVHARLGRLDLGADVLAATELVLAEALNNVVEHAYRNGAGEIALDLDLAESGLAVTVRDHGHALPGACMPAGLPPSVDAARGDLPEGGFGWFLIRNLSRDLTYDRSAAGNRLRFVLPR